MEWSGGGRHGLAGPLAYSTRPTPLLQHQAMQLGRLMRPCLRVRGLLSECVGDGQFDGEHSVLVDGRRDVGWVDVLCGRHLVHATELLAAFLVALPRLLHRVNLYTR